MAIGAGNVIDSFLISLGFRVDPQGGKDLKRQTEQAKEQLLSVGTALKVFATGIAIKGIANIGDSFEKNTIAIAGFLSALGLSSNFNTGLKDAEGILEKITQDAAKLPGTAEDYIEVFRAGLPVLKAAMPGANVTDIAAFSNQIAAIGNTLSIDAPQIGRDLNLMLGPLGRASAQSRTFQGLLTFMKELPGQANLTAASFNAMTQPERFKLLQRTLANPGLVAMIDKMSGSFDAMLGAAKSMVTVLVRKSTVGLFAGMKKGLDEIRALFIDDKNELTEFGKSFVENAKMISGWILQIVTAGAGIVKWLATSEIGTKALKVAMIALGLALSALALQQTVTLFGKLSKLLLNPKLMLIGALAVLIALVAEDLYMFFTNGKSVVGMLRDKFPAAFALVTGGLLALAAAFLVVKAQAIAAGIATAAAWAPVLIPILAVIGAIVGLIALYNTFPKFAAFVDRIGRGFVVMADAIERAVTALGKVMGFATEGDALKGFNVNPTFDRDGVSDVDAGEPTFLQQPAKMTGASAGVTRTVTNTSGKQVKVHVDRPHVIIQTNDPEKMGEEFHRQVTRNAQKAYR